MQPIAENNLFSDYFVLLESIMAIYIIATDYNFVLYFRHF
jgi:hypothetical protein